MSGVIPIKTEATTKTGAKIPSPFAVSVPAPSDVSLSKTFSPRFPVGSSVPNLNVIVSKCVPDSTPTMVANNLSFISQTSSNVSSGRNSPLSGPRNIFFTGGGNGSGGGHSSAVSVGSFFNSLPTDNNSCLSTPCDCDSPGIQLSIQPSVSVSGADTDDDSAFSICLPVNGKMLPPVKRLEHIQSQTPRTPRSVFNDIIIDDNTNNSTTHGPGAGTGAANTNVVVVVQQYDGGRARSKSSTMLDIDHLNLRSPSAGLKPIDVSVSPSLRALLSNAANPCLSQVLLNGNTKEVIIMRNSANMMNINTGDLVAEVPPEDDEENADGGEGHTRETTPIHDLAKLGIQKPTVSVEQPKVEVKVEEDITNDDNNINQNNNNNSNENINDNNNNENSNENENSNKKKKESKSISSVNVDETMDEIETHCSPLAAGNNNNKEEEKSAMNMENMEDINAQYETDNEDVSHSDSGSEQKSEYDESELFDIINGNESPLRQSEEAFLLEQGYAKLNTLTKTLQGCVFKAKNLNISRSLLSTSTSVDNYNSKYSKKRPEPLYSTVVIKRTNKELHSHGITIQDGKQYSVKEDIIKEMKLMKHFMKYSPPSSMIHFLGFFESSTNYYLVMEDGGVDCFDFVVEAHEYIAEGRLKLKEWRKFCKFLFWQMILFVKWLHTEVKCCHLDISLENLLLQNAQFIAKSKNSKLLTLNPQVQIKFCDFGLAEFFDANDVGDFRCTKYCGKVNYKAPQVYHKMGIFDARKADIWSLGIVFFSMVIGAPPYIKPIVGRADDTYDYVERGCIAKLLYEWERNDYVTLRMLNLMNGMLTVDEDERLTVLQIFKHPWLRLYYEQYSSHLKKKQKHSNNKNKKANKNNDHNHNNNNNNNHQKKRRSFFTQHIPERLRSKSTANSPKKKKSDSGSGSGGAGFHRAAKERQKNNLSIYKLEFPTIS